MSDVTGRDSHVIADALATALVALEQLPADKQPRHNMDDMRKLLGALSGGAYVSALLAQAKCRLNPDADPWEIYRSYGIERDERGD